MGASVLLLCGCDDDAPSNKRAPAEPRPSVELTVLVVQNETLAEGMSLLRGEWAERTGGRFTIETSSIDQLPESETPIVDLVVYPSRLLGEFVERGWLRPLRKSVLTSDVAALHDVLPLVRDREATYGRATYAAPLCCDTPLLCYNADALAELNVQKPNTWEEFSEAMEAATRSQPETTGEQGPQDPGDDLTDDKRIKLAYLVLARAAAFTEASRRPTFCFDAEQMTPRLTEPPFIRGLESLGESHTSAGGTSDGHFDAVDAVLSGTAPVAIGWPPSASTAKRSDSEVEVLDPSTWTANVRWTELPSAAQTYDDDAGRWREALVADPPVTLLGPGTMLVSVSSGSRNAVSAFQLCEWLASGQINRQIADSVGSAYPCRRSQLSNIANWLHPELPSAQASEIGQAVEQAMSRNAYAQFPRIPGVDEYLAALGDAVHSFLEDAGSAESVLQSAADRWQQITARRGLNLQLQAYRRHLGLDAADGAGGRN